MNTLGVFSKVCNLHPGKYISEICTAPTCEKRALCVECKKNHISHHLNCLQPLLDFLSFNVDEESLRAVNVDKECEDSIEESTRLLDEALERARRTFEGYLEKIRSDIIEHIRVKEYESARNSQELREEIMRLKVCCFINIKENPEDISVDRQNFVDLCLELKKNIHDSIKRRDLIEKSLNITERDFDNLTDKLKQGLNYFKTSVCVNFSNSTTPINNSFSPAKYTRTQNSHGAITPLNAKSNSESKNTGDNLSDSKSTVTTSPYSVSTASKVSTSTFVLPTKFSAASPSNDHRTGHVRNNSSSKYTPVNISVNLNEPMIPKNGGNKVGVLSMQNYSSKK